MSILINDTEFNLLSGQIQTTGRNLYALITGVSGSNTGNFASITNLQSTGQTLYNNYVTLSGNYVSLSGKVITTGQTLDNKINTLSGYGNSAVQTTGSTLDNKINSLSGICNYRIIQTPRVNFKTVASYNIFTVPTNSLFNLDEMEIVSDIVASPSSAPYIKFGNTSNSGAYWLGSQTTSNSQYSRHIIDNPQDSIAAGIVMTFSIATGSTSITHSGYGIIKGYLIN